MERKTIQLDKSRTALLMMDFQEGIVARQPDARRSMVLEHARAALEAARAAGMLVVYVSVRLRPGYIDVSPKNKRFSAVKASGGLMEGTQEVRIHEAVEPRDSEPLVIKRRVGALTNTDLQVLLNSHDINTLVLCGVSTSGVVLSTVRVASDLDYELFVLEDCCADPNQEVHDFLVKAVFPSQATIATAQDFIAALK
ncbi:MAG: cysteine hydrolase family protein [Chloroflexota bacterium]